MFSQSSVSYPVFSSLEDHTGLGDVHVYMGTRTNISRASYLCITSTCILTRSRVRDQVLPAWAQFQELLVCFHTLHMRAVYSFWAMELHQEVFF